MNRTTVVEGDFVRIPALCRHGDLLWCAWEQRESLDDFGEISIRVCAYDLAGELALGPVTAVSGGARMNPCWIPVGDSLSLLHTVRAPDREEFSCIRDGVRGWSSVEIQSISTASCGPTRACYFEDSDGLVNFIVSPGSGATNGGGPFVAAVTVRDAVPDLDLTDHAGMVRTINRIGYHYRAAVYGPSSDLNRWWVQEELPRGTNETSLAARGSRLYYSTRRALYRGVRTFGVVGVDSWESDLPCPGVHGSLIHDGSAFWACHCANSTARVALSLWRSESLRGGWSQVARVEPRSAGYCSIADAGESIAVLFEAPGSIELTLVPKDRREEFYPDFRARGHDQSWVTT